MNPSADLAKVAQREELARHIAELEARGERFGYKEGDSNNQTVLDIGADNDYI